MTERQALPAIPEDQDYARDSFWAKYRALFYRATPGRKAWDWYEREKKRLVLLQKPFPPAPIFTRRSPAMPIPWDGKSERAGRVPSDGK